MAKHTCGVNIARFLRYVWPFDYDEWIKEQFTNSSINDQLLNLLFFISAANSFSIDMWISIVNTTFILKGLVILMSTKKLEVIEKDKKKFSD